MLLSSQSACLFVEAETGIAHIGGVARIEYLNLCLSGSVSNTGDHHEGAFNGRCSGNANFGFNNLTIKHVVVAEGQLMQTKTSLLMIELPVAGVLIGVVAGVTPGQTPQPDDHGRKAVYDPTLHC
jgi:hypothetical protein